MTVFPPEPRVTANVIVGLIVTLAPTIGPTLGGHLTEWFSWRWLFFINVPPGLLVILLVSRYGDFDKGDPSLSKGIDWLGLGLMTVFLLATQYVIEEGSSNSWFQDDVILWLAVLAALTGPAFIWRQITYRQRYLAGLALECLGLAHRRPLLREDEVGGAAREPQRVRGGGRHGRCVSLGGWGMPGVRRARPRGGAAHVRPGPNSGSEGVVRTRSAAGA